MLMSHAVWSTCCPCFNTLPYVGRFLGTRNKVGCFPLIFRFQMPCIQKVSFTGSLSSRLLSIFFFVVYKYSCPKSICNKILNHFGVVHTLFL